MTSLLFTGHEGVRDLIKFDVTDGFNPLIDRYFYVNVAYMDMLFPDVINKGVTLKEKGRVTLTTGKWVENAEFRLKVFNLRRCYGSWGNFKHGLKCTRILRLTFFLHNNFFY